jgi:hypothetical protein
MIHLHVSGIAEANLLRYANVLLLSVKATAGKGSNLRSASSNRDLG